ncbi:permease of the major facilitator superfamily [Mycena pura]|uniref:Permease of the major facilitator superfamily n=1 Tax=Mycena pura TaxID=153505 RepID=A0AAD6Y9B3_9AGAR|nr:permease of the major facilitator superfamily [Mycena pura]KAJ7206655.1 permease of the major facilitator superfamily [Mycena pura]
MANNVPLIKRPLYAAAIGGMYGVTSVAGPLMGGTFTDKVSCHWRWCFYINLPLGGVTLAIVILLFKMPRAPQIKQEPGTLIMMQRLSLLDPLGTLVFVPAIGGSMYARKFGRIVALLVLFGILIGLFPVQATIPPRILKQRSIWSGSFYQLGIICPLLLCRIWFQAVHGVSAVHSGSDSLPIVFPRPLILASIIAGGLITRVGYYAPFMIVSSVIFAIGAGLTSTLKVTSSPMSWISYEIVCGFGLGLGMQQPLLAVQAQVPVGTAVVFFSQTMGGALFVSVAQSVFTNKLVLGLAARVPGVDPLIVLNAGATSLTDAVPPQLPPDVLRAYNDGVQAIVSTFHCVAIAMATLSVFGAEWRSVKVQRTERVTGT